MAKGATGKLSHKGKGRIPIHPQGSKSCMIKDDADIKKRQGRHKTAQILGGRQHRNRYPNIPKDEQKGCKKTPIVAEIGPVSRCF